MDEARTEGFAPMSVSVTLEDDIDISRGDMIVGDEDLPIVSQDIDLVVCWLGVRPLEVGGKYAVKHTTRDTRAIVKQIRYKIDINTMEKIEGDVTVGPNDVARITIRTTTSLVFDKYNRNRTTGSLILIDEATNVTVGAGMISSPYQAIPDATAGSWSI
jgi:sulfate adenylyltransferase subunit 1